MTERKHLGGGRWLVSAVAAFALVVAQVIGAYAHASDHNHAAGHSACAHYHGHGPAMLSGDGPAGDNADHDGDRAHHDMSCDFLCHGGIAILVTEACAFVDPPPPYVSAVAVGVHTTAPPSLERPPRSSVRA